MALNKSSGTVSFNIVNATKVRENLNRLSKQFPREAAVALNIVAEETMTDAKRRTPVDTGTLRRSGKVHKRASARNLKAELSFATEYAAAVHERVYAPSGARVRHRVGEAKYLENAIKSTSNWMAHRVANEISVRVAGQGPSGARSTKGVGI